LKEVEQEARIRRYTLTQEFTDLRGRINRGDFTKPSIEDPSAPGTFIQQSPPGFDRRTPNDFV
jgi:hypothetical protein